MGGKSKAQQQVASSVPDSVPTAQATGYYAINPQITDRAPAGEGELERIAGQLQAGFGGQEPDHLSRLASTYSPIDVVNYKAAHDAPPASPPPPPASPPPPPAASTPALHPVHQGPHQGIDIQLASNPFYWGSPY